MSIFTPFCQRDCLTLSSSFLAGEDRPTRDVPLPIISALNLILSAFPASPAGQGVMVGWDKFFSRFGGVRPVSLGGGLEAWKGFYGTPMYVVVHSRSSSPPNLLLQANHSFVGSLFAGSKVILCAVMVRDQYRSLPMPLDRAIVLPRVSQKKKARLLVPMLPLESCTGRLRPV